nr:MAG TPA: hypothetical protein [Caudoviricetes sp.]
MVILSVEYSTYICYCIFIKKNKKGGTPPSIRRHQSKKKGSYIIAQVKRNEKNKQQRSNGSN